MLARIMAVARVSARMTDLQGRILDAMADGDRYTVGEITEEVDEPRRTVQYNMKRLADQGEINRKKHTEKVILYWVE